MPRSVVYALRGVIAGGIAIALLIQTVLVPLLVKDFNDDVGAELQHVGVPVALIVLVGMLALEIIAVCVWRLLTMAYAGSVFSRAAFRYVDVIIGAVTASAVLLFALAVLLAPGEAVAPGAVGLVCALSLAVGGVALIVLILRMLLMQAVDRDARATQLEAELEAVI